MKPFDHPFWRASCLLLCLAAPAAAQIVPDATLPVPSRVTSGGSTQVITGGTSAGSNLFHSFERFSIPAGSAAHFQNSPDVQNIITRVTGDLASQINGSLQTSGTANLFVLNPNGIIFGPGATLNIGGTFLATTASSIKLADGTEFGSPPAGGKPSGAPLLTVSVPAGLQFGKTAAPVQIQGATLRAAGLAFAGGDIQVSGARLLSDGGAIDLGAVGPHSLVSLSPSPLAARFSYEGVRQFRDIHLSSASEIDSSGPGSGPIQLQGRNVTLSGGSGIHAETRGWRPGAAVAVRAAEAVELAGTSADDLFPSFLATATQGEGAAGDLEITAGKLTVRDGAQISADTSSSGAGGKIAIRATESVRLVGESPNFTSGVFSQTSGTGAAGQLTIATGQLTVRDGAQVSVSTFGPGEAGVLAVSAASFVELTGAGVGASGLFAQVEREATGHGGNLIVETGRLRAEGGAIVSASTFGPGAAGNLLVRAAEKVELSGASGLFAQVEAGATGQGGNLTIETGQLLVRDGGQISATTFGQGLAGNITVRAASDVELVGNNRVGDVPSGLYSRSRSGVSAGNLQIVTPRLTVRDGAILAVSNRGAGDAGNLKIQAGSTHLNAGSISAETASGEGGNLILQVRDLQLRHHSALSTTADGTGNGGNITISAGSVAALEDSDIRANAFQGRGGNINITTRGLFQSPDSEITASSALGIAGAITLNRPDADSSGLLGLSEKVVDLSTLINQNCSSQHLANSFYVTGRGGIPPSPLDPILGHLVLVDLSEPAFEKGKEADRYRTGVSQQSREKDSLALWDSRPPLVEATGWAISAGGEVILTNTAGTPGTPWLTPAACRTSNRQNTGQLSTDN